MKNLSLPSVTVCGLQLDARKRVLVNDLDIEVQPGQSLAIVGPSGSGKTTLLQTIAGILLPTSGVVSIGETPISTLSAAKRGAIRLEKIGLVFQFGELLPELTVIDNVALPLELRNMKRASALTAARQALARVDMDSYATSHPQDLSGGETQRVGIARAIAGSPTLILADEPTGALDEENSLRTTSVLLDVSRTANAGLIVATHDPLVYEQMESVLDLRSFMRQRTKVA